MERVRTRCGFFNGIDVAAEGSRGGLSLGWNRGQLVNLKSFSKSHIDVEIQEEENPQWRFTGFYGSPEVRNKAETWDQLRQLGGTTGYLGWLEFTWERGRILERNIRERIDRGVATNSWLQNFLNYLLRHLPHSFSDHCPLLIEMEVERKGRISSRFRFESWWVLEETCEEEIRKLWEESSGPYLNHMRYLATRLKAWGKNYSSNTRVKYKELNDEEISEETLAEILEVKLHLNMEMDKEERYWKQCARVNWLQMGDKNTYFFHKSASQRRRINRIRRLQRTDGSVVTNEKEIEEIARKYFANLFESRGVGDVIHILSGVQPCISESMNQELLAPFTKTEIIEALKGMGPTKAAGFNGFPAIFYKKFWHILGRDTSDFCLEVLNNGISLDEINRTMVVLIPKIASPTNLKNFRPISLCTVIYKIITKSVANRLKKVLEVCIDNYQSAFVPGRLITDNVLLAYEVLHSLKNKRSGRKGLMALKLDMSKAYD
ncbi:reverse transcriptase [Gossypium australe]|uniref:Reverse transcriptase n=1 Tax=Gossypium australe TaxID=47621 RepID=A0A5B6VWD5_9ROSI|nr:reverse transcriptase [Gossypium australe]